MFAQTAPELMPTNNCQLPNDVCSVSIPHVLCYYLVRCHNWIRLSQQLNFNRKEIRVVVEKDSALHFRCRWLREREVVVNKLH